MRNQAHIKTERTVQRHWPRVYLCINSLDPKQISGFGTPEQEFTKLARNKGQRS